MSKAETNVEFITRVMEFSPFGVLTQAFIMDAITQHAQHVVHDPLDHWPENHIIDKTAWKNTAANLVEELTARGYIKG